MDCIVTYHQNPMRCGIAKFNHALGQRLGLPVVGMFDPALERYAEPLLSIKFGELSPVDQDRFEQLLDRLEARAAPRVFLHGYGGTRAEQRLLRMAADVFCGNAELVAQIRPERPDAVEAWCPGMVQDRKPFPATELSVFTFGMAHKVKTRDYRRLRELLDATGRSYSLYVSTALHEGTSFDEEFGAAFEQIKALFNGQAFFLGYLSDAAVYNRLIDSTYFAAFFDGGARSNNTSVNAAMEAGRVVITNLDDYSPPALRHMENVIDIRRATRLPVDPAELEELGARARDVAGSVLGWDALIGRLEGTARQVGPAPALQVQAAKSALTGR
jgi:hypothetical protein